MPETIYLKRCRQKKRVLGLCRDCGQKALQGMLYCESCTTLRKERYETKLLAGLCPSCGKREPLPEKKWCEVCLGKIKSRKLLRDSQRMAEGRCIECGIEKPSAKKKHCDPCLREMRIESLLIRTTNVKNSLCVNCGKYPILEQLKSSALSSNYCERCYLKKVSSRTFGRSILWKALHRKLQEQQYRCQYSGDVIILGVNDSVDHINPISRFPDQRLDLDNIEWVTREVNRAKHNLTKPEFCALIIKMSRCLGASPWTTVQAS